MGVPQTWDEAAGIFTEGRDPNPGGFTTPRSQTPNGFAPTRGQDPGFSSPRGGGMGAGTLPADLQWGGQQAGFANFGEQQNALANAAIAEAQASIQAAIDAQEKSGVANSGASQPAKPGMSGDWAYLNTFDKTYTGASEQTGVPGNAIKAVQKLETGGADYTGKENCTMRPEAGCVALNSGIFKATADYYGLDYERIRDDPEYAIYAIGVVMNGIAQSDTSEYKGEGGQTVLEAGGWELVAAVYHGGDVNVGFVDENGVSSAEYVGHIERYLNELGGIDAPVESEYVAPGGAPTITEYSPPGGDRGQVIAHAPAGSSIAALPDMWGGTDEYISQGLDDGHGGEIANNNPGIYDYAKEYGYDGHPGIDVALAAGTPLTSPISGQVVLVGGDYFTDPYGVGEVRIVAPNGDVVILGHMRDTHLRPGDMVNAGDPVGSSGQSDQRAESAHLHLEVRVLQPDGSFRIADPTVYFSPAPTGGPR